MATHSSILAWRIPWTEEPDKLHSIGLQSQTQLKQFIMHACSILYSLHLKIDIVQNDFSSPNPYSYPLFITLKLLLYSFSSFNIPGSLYNSWLLPLLFHLPGVFFI